MNRDYGIVASNVDGRPDNFHLSLACEQLHSAKFSNLEIVELDDGIHPCNRCAEQSFAFKNQRQNWGSEDENICKECGSELDSDGNCTFQCERLEL